MTKSFGALIAVVVIVMMIMALWARDGLQQGLAEWKEWCTTVGGTPLDQTRIPPSQTIEGTYYYCMRDGEIVGSL